MKNQLYILVVAAAAVAFCGCSKDDEGGESGKFYVQVPGFVKCTTPIRVDLTVPCDKAPTVTFSTENDGLGVVSSVEVSEFDTDYVYAGEPVKNVQFANGQATVTFWYIPLTPGDHAVDFTATYTLNGIAKTLTTRSVLSVSDAANGGFYPEVVGGDPGRYYFSFRNALENTSTGCDFRVAFVALNGKSDYTPNYLTLSQEKSDRITMEKNVFYSIKPNEWNEKFEKWLGGNVILAWIWDDSKNECSTYALEAISLNFICRDNFNRCRDVIVETDTMGNVISSVSSDYYLWEH